MLERSRDHLNGAEVFRSVFGAFGIRRFIFACGSDAQGSSDSDSNHTEIFALCDISFCALGP